MLNKKAKPKSRILTVVLFLLGLLFLFITFFVGFEGNITYNGSPVFKAYILSIILLPLTVLSFAIFICRIYKHFKTNPIFSGIFIFLISATFILIGFALIRSTQGRWFILRWILMILGGLILFVLIPYLAYKQFNPHPIFSSFLIGLVISEVISFMAMVVAVSDQDALAILGFWIVSFQAFIIVSIISIIVGWIINKNRKK